MRPFNPLQRPDWDAQLARRPDFSFFHGSAWIKVLAETYGFTPVFFETENSVLPAMEVRSRLTGNRGVALPFTDECEPLAENENSFRQLFDAAVAFGKSRGWRYLELRGGRNFLGEVPASLSFYNHGLNLATDEKLMFDKMDSSMRRAVRKAENEGVAVEVSQSMEAAKIFYELQCLTRRRHGLPPPPFRFFVNIHRHLLSQNLGMIAVACHAGKKIAAAVYFFSGATAIYKYGASDFARQELRGSNLVMWSAMKWLAQNGIKNLSLGKTAMDNAGLRRFKLNLGAAEEQLDYVKYDLRREKFVTDTDAITGWHNRVFRMLPLGASRLAGELLYKHWA